MMYYLHGENNRKVTDWHTVSMVDSHGDIQRMREWCNSHDSEGLWFCLTRNSDGVSRVPVNHWSFELIEDAVMFALIFK